MIYIFDSDVLLYTKYIYNERFNPVFEYKITFSICLSKSWCEIFVLKLSSIQSILYPFSSYNNNYSTFYIQKRKIELKQKIKFLFALSSQEKSRKKQRHISPFYPYVDCLNIHRFSSMCLLENTYLSSCYNIQMSHQYCQTF